MFVSFSSTVQPLCDKLSDQQASSASVAYALLGGFVIVVCLILSSPDAEPSNCYQVQLDILDHKREGEIPTIYLGLRSLIATNSYT
jgi:hypothetical protein